MKLEMYFLKTILRCMTLLAFVVVASCGGGGSSAAATNPATNSDCIINQSQIGSCTLG